MKTAATAERIGGDKLLSDDDAGFEFMMNALRLRQPVTGSLFRERTGLPLSRYESILEQAQADGLLEFDGSRIAVTPHGRRFLNDLMQRFLPEPDGLISTQSPT